MKITFDYVINWWAHKNDIMDALRKEMKDYFKDKSYSEDVEEFYFALLEPGIFILHKRPKYTAFRKDVAGFISLEDMAQWEKTGIRPECITVKQLFVDMEIDDIDSFYKGSSQESYNIVARSILNYLGEMKPPVKIRKTFEKERFVRDFRAFFTERMGCDPGILGE